VGMSRYCLEHQNCAHVRLFLFAGSRQTAGYTVMLLVYFLKLKTLFQVENHLVALFELPSSTPKQNYNFTFEVYGKVVTN
jgi:hypothetical protein